MLVVTDLGMAGRIVGGGLLLRDLIEHGVEQEVNSRVSFNHLLELFEDGM